MSCEYKRREIVSLVVFQCVKIRVCSSIPGISMELPHDVRQDLSDVCANTRHMARDVTILLVLISQCLIFIFFPKSNVILCGYVLKSLLS